MSELREVRMEPYAGLQDDGMAAVVEVTRVSDTEETALEWLRDMLELFDLDGPVICDGKVWIEVEPGGDIGGYQQCDEDDLHARSAWLFDTSECRT